MLITQSRDNFSKNNNRNEVQISSKKNDQSKGSPYYKNKKVLGFQNIENIKRRKWVKIKRTVSRFLDEQDYNNQTHSSYDLTLLERQNNYDKHDAA